MSYFAFHSSFFESSLYRSGLTNFSVFLWLCSHCDEEGTVIARPWAIAQQLSMGEPARFTEATVKAALDYLSLPDPESRRQEDEGRRIVQVEGANHTWRIVSYVYFNREWATERRRVKARDRQRRLRAREDEQGAVSNASVTPRHASSHPNTDSDSEPKTKKKREPGASRHPLDLGRGEAKNAEPYSPEFEALWAIYPANRGTLSKGSKPKAYALWLPLKERHGEIMKAVPNYAASEGVAKEGRSMYLAKWLEEGWESWRKVTRARVAPPTGFDLSDLSDPPERAAKIPKPSEKPADAAGDGEPESLASVGPGESPASEPDDDAEVLELLASLGGRDTSLSA